MTFIMIWLRINTLHKSSRLDVALVHVLTVLQHIIYICTPKGGRICNVYVMFIHNYVKAQHKGLTWKLKCVKYVYWWHNTAVSMEVCPVALYTYT